MMGEIALGFGIIIAIIAFISEYTDSTLGMGYGTILTPLLLLMGFDPLQIVPSILLSELITGISAGVLHHKAGNVYLRPKTINPFKAMKKIKENGVKDSVKRGLPLHLKVALLIAVCSVVGVVAAVFLAINLPKFYLKLYIGILISVIGIFILVTLKKNYKFSWKKITLLGVIASFNKGISGGGYGPVVTGGQILSGIDGRKAIGITSLAEGFTCLAGIIVYLIVKPGIDWVLAPFLVVGAILSVPLSVFTVKKIKINKMKFIIGIVTLFLGILTIIKLFS